VQRAIRLDLPCRMRANSTKCLLLFELAGDYAKQILQTPCGVIEFLATGQQCVIAGVHPSGSRHTWRDGCPSVIQKLTQDQFLSIQQELRVRFGTADWTEGRLRKAREVAVVSSV